MDATGRWSFPFLLGFGNFFRGELLNFRWVVSSLPSLHRSCLVVELVSAEKTPAKTTFWPSQKHAKLQVVSWKFAKAHEKNKSWSLIQEKRAQKSGLFFFPPIFRGCGGILFGSANDLRSCWKLCDCRQEAKQSRDSTSMEVGDS